MPKNRDTNLAEMAYQALLKKIITLELEPGEPLNEQALLAELGISRTPLREALTRLKREQLVEGQPNKTSYVQRISMDSFRDLVESLLIAEKTLSFIAAQRATSRDLTEIEHCHEVMVQSVEAGKHWEFISQNFSFHGLIAKAARNQCLFRFHEDLRRQVQRLAYISISYDIQGQGSSVQDHNKLLCDHHAELVEYLKTRSPNQAARVSSEHIKAFQARIIAYYCSINQPMIDNLENMDA